MGHVFEQLFIIKNEHRNILADYIFHEKVINVVFPNLFINK